MNSEIDNKIKEQKLLVKSVLCKTKFLLKKLYHMITKINNENIFNESLDENISYNF